MNILVGHVESIWCRGSFNLGTVCVNLRELMLEPQIGTIIQVLDTSKGVQR